MGFHLENGLTPDVVSEIDLTEDQKRRVLSMVFGMNKFDFQGDYVDRARQEHRLARVHFTARPTGVPGAYSDIDGIDGTHLGDIEVVLEDQDGEKTGWQDAREVIGASWHRGVIFQGDDGAGWFCGFDTLDQADVTANAPVMRPISLDTLAIVQAENGDIPDLLPSEGEFWLSHEDMPRVTAIPWCAGFAEPAEADDTWPGRAENRQRERSELDAMKIRASEIVSQTPSLT